MRKSLISVGQFPLFGSRAEFIGPPRLEVCDRGEEDGRVSVDPFDRPDELGLLGERSRCLRVDDQLVEGSAKLGDAAGR